MFAGAKHVQMLSYFSRYRSQVTDALRGAQLSERLQSAALSALNVNQEAIGRGFATSVFNCTKGNTVRGKVPDGGLLLLNSLHPNPGAKKAVRVVFLSRMLNKKTPHDIRYLLSSTSGINCLPNMWRECTCKCHDRRAGWDIVKPSR